MKIGVFDSGIGGWSILAQVLHDNPDHEFVYLADQRYAPYSEKSLAELQAICARNVDILMSFDCEMIIVACNTATVMTIGELRRRYPGVPIVGTEPAVKPASEQLPHQSDVVVLATKNTVESAALSNLLQPYQRRTRFHLVGSTTLVQAIEAQNWQHVALEVQILLSPFKKIDGLVLGCTHFPLILPELEAYFSGAGLPRIFLPNQGVSRRVLQVLSEVDVSTDKQRSGKVSVPVRLLSSAETELEPLWQSLQDRLKLQLNFDTLPRA